MRVAVITPYYNEPIEKLERCRDSVAKQMYSCTHYFVSDGKPQDVIDSWDVVHMRVPNHKDYGDTPRALGSLSAASNGFDAVMWLDGDNWYEPNHVMNMVSLAKSKNVAVVTCGRMLRRLDGTELGICTEPDGKTFVDTNCYLVTRPAFGLLPVWILKDKKMSIVGDRVFFNTLLSNKVSHFHTPDATVNYESGIAVHYWQRGETPPPESKVLTQLPGEPEPRAVPYPEFVAKGGRFG